MRIKDVPDFAWNAVSDAERKDFMKRCKDNAKASKRAWKEYGMAFAQ